MAVISPGEGHSCEPVRRDVDVLARARCVATFPLRQAEVDVNGVELLERRDLVAGVQVLAGVDRGDAELAAERRADRLLRHERGLLCGQRPLARRIGIIRVELRLADGAERELSPVASEDAICKISGGLEGLELGLISVSIERDEHGLRLHVLSRLHFDAADESRNLCCHVDPAHRAERPYGGELWLPLKRVHLDGRYRLGPRFGRRGDELADVEVEPACEQHHQREHAAEHDEHSFSHGRPSRGLPIARGRRTTINARVRAARDPRSRRSRPRRGSTNRPRAL